MVDVNGTVYHLRTDMCTLGKGYHNFADPTMVDVNGTVHHLRKDICTLGIGYHNFACPHNGEVILKYILYDNIRNHIVSVPAMVDVNSTVCYLRTDIWTWGKDTIILPTPQWGSNSKVYIVCTSNE